MAGETMQSVGQHVLSDLPYPFDALEPHIDARTVEIHHDKHHATYVKGLNAAEEALAKAREANDFSMIQHWERQAAFHGGGDYLHTLYWASMTHASRAVAEPTGALAEKIREDFRDFATFKAQFSAAAVAVEGNGWALMGLRPTDDRLVVLQVENHQKLSPWNVVPLMVADVWEHAYYLKYQNMRADYVKAWWNVVNWEQISENYERFSRM